MTGGKLLLIDSDATHTNTLSERLLLEGFESSIASSAETGLTLALNESFDAIILELLLPQQNGFQFLESLRVKKQTPVLFLTSCQTQIDRMMGLELGGDDYITKPYIFHELLVRLRAILRRSQPERIPSAQKVTWGDIVLDIAQHKVTRNNQRLELTNTEFKLLEILLKSPGEAFSKETLTEHALNRKFTAYDRSIDVHISNLRQKLGLSAQNKPFIQTVRGFGYLFQPEEECV